MELFDACEWYEEQQKGLSLYIRRMVKKTLDTIILNPALYAPKYNNELHFAPLNKFPYVIIYWYDESLKTIFVVSIFHTKRNPKDFER